MFAGILTEAYLRICSDGVAVTGYEFEGIDRLSLTAS